MSFKQEMTLSAESVSQLLLKKKWQLVTAESCTGGLIGAVCTDLSGSSAWFFGGVISYANEAKERGLGVSPDTLKSHGAVSEQTVEQMCSGALRLGGDVAIAVSGVAGPSGGTQDKPVGCVYIGWQVKGKSPQVQRFQFAGDREAIREATVLAAFDGFIEQLTAVEK